MDRRATTEAELETLDGYRKLSPLALAAFALGVLSALAFTASSLLCIPVLAILAAIAALISINARPEQLAGKPLARCGLALAICFAAAAILRTQTTTYLFQRQARATTQTWLNKLAAGKFKEAIPYLGPNAIATLMPPREQDQPMMPPEEARVFMINSLRHSPLAAELAKLPDDVRLKRISPATAPVAYRNGQTVTALYEINSSSASPLLLSMRLGTPPAGYEQPLYIEHWELLKKKSELEAGTE